MARIVVVANVKDVVMWEENYRSHAPELREILGVTKPVQFHTNAENSEVCISAEPDDLEHYLKMLQSPEMAEAMDENGVLRDTVKLYILDKSLDS